MKRIAPTLVLLFMFCYISGQDVMTKQQSAETLDYFETGNSEILNAERKFKYHILYSSSLPIAEVGLKIAFLREWGGYISGGININQESIWSESKYYISGGVLKKINQIINLYAGTGMIPEVIWTSDSGSWGWDRVIIIEIGALINIKHLSLEAGVGCGVIESAIAGVWNISKLRFDIGHPYAKLGVGVNF